MNDKKNIQALNNASQKKRDDTFDRVINALKIMEKEGISINFLSVSKFTGVARSWLYKESAIKEIIKQTKTPSNNQLMQDQAVKLKATQREVDILSKQNKHLRQQIEELRKQLEVAYAEFYKNKRSGSV